VCCVLGRYFAHPHETEVRTLVECATPKREKMGGPYKRSPLFAPVLFRLFIIYSGTYYFLMPPFCNFKRNSRLFSYIYLYNTNF